MVRLSDGLSAEWEGGRECAAEKESKEKCSLSIFALIQLQLNSVMPTFVMPCTDNHCSFCGAVSYLRIVPVTIPLSLTLSFHGASN